MSQELPSPTLPRQTPAKAVGARSAWLKTLHQWHWISSALCLIGMLLFAGTGITLNHASSIESQPTVVTRQAQVPERLMPALSDAAESAASQRDPSSSSATRAGASTSTSTGPNASTGTTATGSNTTTNSNSNSNNNTSRTQDAKAALPPPLRDWLAKTLGRPVDDRDAEWSRDEIYLSMPRPGGDAWIRIDRATGDVEYEDTDRGWISYLNDLHKGRHAGLAWSWFLDLFAAACVLFSVTGLLILKFHAVSRPSTWPIVGLGFLIPALLALLFMH